MRYIIIRSSKPFKKLLLFITSLFLTWQCFALTCTLEDVIFESHDALIKGTLVVPNTPAPVPAMIMIHGAGDTPRNLYYAKFLARMGVAVLTYDKRGCGESEGAYEHDSNVSTENLKLLADDALAGFQTLKNHPRIDQRLIGIWGISQAGWIAPIVAAKDPDVAFAVMLSCPTITVPEQIRYRNIAADDPLFFESYSQEMIHQFITDEASVGLDFASMGYELDPMPYWKTLDIPVLWVFGDRDRSVPAEICIEKIEGLRNGEHLVKLYPEYTHALMPPGATRGPTKEIDAFYVEWIKGLASNMSVHSTPDSRSAPSGRE